MTNEQSEATVEGQTPYAYSVKIEQTALGARVSVHAYGDDINYVLNHAQYLYAESRKQLIEGGFTVAPEEPKATKKADKQ